jgi:predicted glycosyltransferase
MWRAALGDRDALRRELGYPADVPVVVVTVGGSGVGAGLLRKVIDAYPAARKQIDGLRLLVVAGPRIDPSLWPEHDGIDVRGYVPDLHRHLAACDAAIIQGGLTTAMELVATGRPIAAALAEELARPPDYQPVPGDGAQRAAALIAELI